MRGKLSTSSRSTYLFTLASKTSTVPAGSTGTKKTYECSEAPAHFLNPRIPTAMTESGPFAVGKPHMALDLR